MKRYITKSVLILGLLTSASGAIYYKSRAADYELRWEKAMKQLTRAIQSRAPKSFDPTPITEFNTNEMGSFEEERSALHQEIEQLELELILLKSSTNQVARKVAPPSAEERQERMEELKEADPELYASIMTRREEMETRLQTAFAERAATLLDRSSSQRSEKAEIQRDLMLNTLNETWELAEQMASSETPPEERREIRDELTEKTKELRPLLRDERDQQFFELAVGSGYNEEDAEIFVSYINESIQATSMPSFGNRNSSRRARP